MLVDRDALLERAARPNSAKPRPFLRWAGSKRFALADIVRVLPSEFGTYFEPFLGAGSLFFLLQPPRAVLTDSCTELIDTFRAVRDNVSAVSRCVRPLRPSPEVYYRIRQRRSFGRFKRAAQFIYLNKVCWNGLYRVSSRGLFNVPYGMPRSQNIVDLQNLKACSRALQKPGVKLKACDFEEALSRVSAGDLVYLDPPYVTGHTNNGFVDYNEVLFSWHDQQRLARLADGLRRAGAHVLVSCANQPAVRKLYPRFTHSVLRRRSTLASDVSKRKPVTELLLIPAG